MCVRCGERDAGFGESLCSVCTISVKVEVARGLQALGGYLERHAAFGLWLEEPRGT
jgi:hypothetical protein